MAVVLWDIDVTKRRDNNSLTSTSCVEDWSLDDYYEVAKRCIGAFAAGSLAQSMLRSEDAISFVAEHLMYGALRWKADGGRTIHSYLNQCAVWAIGRWITITKRLSNKPQVLSLNTSGADSRRQLYQMVPDDDAMSPDDVLADEEKSDALANIIDDAGLTDRQRHCLEIVYIQGLKPAEVARSLGISRQAVDQCLTKGIRKLRGALDGKETLFA